MAELPYWFTGEDKSNPVYCRACKQHIPRTVYAAGRGLCPNCMSRVKSRPSTPGNESLPSIASAPAPAMTGYVAPLPKASTNPTKQTASGFRIPGPVIAVLILLAGAAIAFARVTLHI